jgi:hypothetical protein
MAIVSEANLDVLKSKVVRQFSEIKEVDLDFVHDNENELVIVMQQKLGKTEEEVNNILLEIKSKTLL